MNRKAVHFALAVSLGPLLGGCSSEDNEVKEHVWKDQVEAIDKARQVEDVLRDAAAKQKDAAQDSSY